MFRGGRYSKPVFAHQLYLARLVPQALDPMRSLLAAFVLAAMPAVAQDATTPEGWWKGNLHTHSLWSDGNDFPDMIADWYKARGYHFLALSDHNILADHDKWMQVDLVVRRGGRKALADYRTRFGEAWVETREKDAKLEVRLKRLDEFGPLLEEPGRFLLIPAEEITDSFAKAPLHLNATNVGERIAPQGGDSVEAVLRNNLRAVIAQAQRLARPILAHVNHPNFQWAMTAEAMAHVLEERFFEVYNGHDQVHHLGDAQRPGTERLWDIVNALRLVELKAPPLFGVATDDCHNYHSKLGSTPGRGWVMVRADELSATALVLAMEHADFYASSGVTLEDVTFDAKTLRLKVAAEAGVSYRTEFVGTRVGVDLSSEPTRDAEGKEMVATRTYRGEIGVVLAVVEGTAPSYALQGDELYVRAVVTADRAHPNPSFEDQREQAWTQPVGWQRHLR